MKFCKGQQICAKCGEKDLDHMAEDCLKENRCSNFQQGHLAYAISCNIDKKEKEILEVKPKTNVSFQKARKTLGSFMGENMLLLHGEWIQINQENEYRALVERRIQLEQNDWPKFQDHLKKKIHLAEFQQAQTQQEVKNEEKSNVT